MKTQQADAALKLAMADMAAGKFTEVGAADSHAAAWSLGFYLETDQPVMLHIAETYSAIYLIAEDMLEVAIMGESCGVAYTAQGTVSTATGENVEYI